MPETTASKIHLNQLVVFYRYRRLWLMDQGSRRSCCWKAELLPQKTPSRGLVVGRYLL